ncbi:BREX system Lon protease-like protein BrxL [Nocardia blacklockiae]|uniref:BREX system Lon protease-like protein BrxL n=1 Tax=Nocardia blacklockiae TaxID=480036 RepID=UPI001E3C28E2|nr:BREX system Lon protease-like protein BrxL [Nocardia blacklockiae]
MKLLYPHEKATTEESEEILRFAIEGRKRVRPDPAYRRHHDHGEFRYQPLAGEWTAVTTLEEHEYPGHYCRGRPSAVGVDEEAAGPATPTTRLLRLQGARRHGAKRGVVKVRRSSLPLLWE